MVKINKSRRSPSGRSNKRKQPVRPAGSQQGVLQQALALHQAGRLPQAEAIYRQILLDEPNHPMALHYLGMLAHQAGKSDIALELMNRALNSRPDYVEAHNNRGVILRALGRLEEAAASYRQALAAKPNYADARYNLGVALQEQGKLDKAVDAYRRTLATRPDYAEAHLNLGVCLTEQGKMHEAVDSYRRALKVLPDHPEVHNNLGTAFTGQGRLDEAVASFRRALTLQPEYAEAHYNLGNALRDQGKLGEAVASFRRALTLRPEYAEAHYNLALVLQVQGELEEAVAEYRRALALQPDYADAHSNLLLCLNYLPHVTQREIYEESKRWGERYAPRAPAQDPWCAVEREASRRLKIGYVSSDFRDHSVAYFIEPILQAHNRQQVEVYCYANVRRPDDKTKQLQTLSDHWCSIAGMPDGEVVERIRRDRIDILVDLGGHTGEKRLQVFAGKPSPVLVTWLGYPNTTGMRAMDYRLTDEAADPVGEADALHSEKLVRLEHGFLCYRPDVSAPEVASPPCLTRGYVTFGSFNNLSKVNRDVIKVWAEILHRLPSSRLLLKSKPLQDPPSRERCLRLFAEQGISAERLELHGWLPTKKSHLELYHDIDIGLDPFPYNGTTTTCEALWMGVPVVTMLGKRHAGRVGASIMQHAGLDELVALSVEEYKALAVSLSDPHRLQTFRGGLRQRLAESRLLEKEGFCAVLEEAFRQMWQEWCAGSENAATNHPAPDGALGEGDEGLKK